jgi:hypothetical protein
MTDPDNDNPMPFKLFWLSLLVITILAGGMRMYKLSDYSFWEDELYSVRSATKQSPWQISKQFGFVPTTLGLWADGAQLDKVNWDNVSEWQALGVRPFGARIGSCLVGILTIPLLGFASRRLLGERTALIAALLLAVSPWHLFWSQAARFYSLQFLFYNLALIWYLRTCRERSDKLAVFAALAMVLAYLSQPPAILFCLVLVGDVIFCLIRREPIGLTKTGWALGIGAALLCVGLQIYDMIDSAEAYQYHGSLQGHTWDVIGSSMILRNHPVLLAVAGLSLIGLVRKKPRLMLYLAMAGVLPVAALMGLSLIAEVYDLNSYVHERYCFIIHYAWLAMAAVGLGVMWESTQTQWGRRTASIGVVAVAVSLLWSNLGYYQDGNRRRWEEAFAYVAIHRQPGEDVATLSSNKTPIARYYLQTNDVLPYADFPTSPEELDTLTKPTWLVLPAVSATRGELYPWLNDLASLKSYYDLRIFQPFASIRVYYHTPSNTQSTAE